MAYRFIQQYGHKYGVRWLLKRLSILPNAYYNFLKNRKSEYHKRKEKIKHEIVDIYHSHNGTDGYRTVHAYLLRKGYSISCVTVHKYMNTELQLFSITVRDVASMLGRKECTIRRRIENGLLPAHKVGRCWYILKSEFVDGLRNI